MLFPLQSIEYEPNESGYQDAGDHAGDPAGEVGAKYVKRGRAPTAGERENQSRSEARREKLHWTAAIGSHWRGARVLAWMESAAR